MEELIIKRDLYLNKLICKKNNGSIKIITGLRRYNRWYKHSPNKPNFLCERAVKRCINVGKND